jgi:hypothetical protein
MVSRSRSEDAGRWRLGDFGAVEEGRAREAADAEKSKCAANIFTEALAKGYRCPFTRFCYWLMLSELRPLS